MIHRARDMAGDGVDGLDRARRSAPRARASISRIRGRAAARSSSAVLDHGRAATGVQARRFGRRCHRRQTRALADSQRAAAASQALIAAVEHGHRVDVPAIAAATTAGPQTMPFALVVGDDLGVAADSRVARARRAKSSGAGSGWRPVVGGQSGADKSRLRSA